MKSSLAHSPMQRYFASVGFSVRSVLVGLRCAVLGGGNAIDRYDDLIRA